MKKNKTFEQKKKKYLTDKQSFNFKKKKTYSFEMIFFFNKFQISVKLLINNKKKIFFSFLFFS